MFLANAGGMILPLLAFFTLATLLCAVVGADRQDNPGSGPRETRPGFPPRGELPPEARVGSPNTTRACPAAGKLPAGPAGGPAAGPAPAFRIGPHSA